MHCFISYMGHIMHRHHNHLLIESPVHLVIGPPPNDPEEFWPPRLFFQQDEDAGEESGSSHCGYTSEDYSTGGEDDPTSPTAYTSDLSGLPRRPPPCSTKPRRHHHRHEYHSLRHPWIWGIVDHGPITQSGVRHDEQQSSSSAQSRATDDWVDRISHFTFVAKPKALGVWPPSQPKPHECLPPSLYYSLLLTAYGTQQKADGRGDGVEQASAELDGYVVLKRWVIPFVHRLGDGHDDAGGLTTRLCSGSSENQRTAVGDSLGDDEATERLDQDAEYEVSDEDDGGTFIARKWDFLKSITAGSNQDANTVTDEAKEDALLYLMINTLQAEDSAASQIQAHFLEPVTQTKNAALPGFEEYWIETLHEHGLRVGLQVVQGPFAEQQQEEYQIPVDWSGSPFSYCSADMRTLLPL